MELLRVVPSAEDGVNAACFHPAVGGGLVYRTKVINLYMFKTICRDVQLFLVDLTI